MRLALAEILFAHPALLGGIALAAVPIVIHLLLRPRPRRTRFPAIVLLRRVVLTGQRSSRFQNLMLMLVRAAFLALLALLLAAPVRTDGAVDFVGPDPLLCAVVLDESASMNYRVDGATTRLDLSRAAATDFVHQSAPAGRFSTRRAHQRHARRNPSRTGQRSPRAAGTPRRRRPTRQRQTTRHRHLRRRPSA